MSAEISPRLSSKFDEHPEDPGHRESVLVTLDQPVDRETLTASGLTVNFMSHDGKIAAGTLDRAALNQLAEAPGIVSIEPDTEMHALDTEM